MESKQLEEASHSCQTSQDFIFSPMSFQPGNNREMASLPDPLCIYARGSNLRRDTVVVTQHLSPSTWTAEIVDTWASKLR